MRYGIFSDVHSNREAFEAVISALKKETVDEFLCPGDIVGYGADPDECIRLVRQLKAVSVAGNHDWAVLGQADIHYFNPIAKEAVLWTRENLTADGKQFLETLPLTYQNEDLLMVHAALPHPESFEYLMNTEMAGQMFSVMDKDICFIGHTHVPVIVKQDQSKINVKNPLDIKLQDGCRYIVNVGSVGQPRDGDPRAAYGVFDSTARTVTIKRVEYDIKKAQSKIIAAGLPPALASRLGYGE